MIRARFLASLAGLIALAIGALWLAAGSSSASTEPGAPMPSLRPLAVPNYDGSVESLKHPTLASDLVQLADAAERAAAFGATIASDSPLPRQLSAAVAARQLRLTDDGLVQVYVHLDGSHDVAPALASAGADIERASDGRIQAWVPAIGLPSIAILPGVASVRLPDYPFLNVGSELTEGDAVLNADDVRDMFGVDGSGFSVGVISDGVGGLAAAQASGNLPAVDTSTCNTHGSDPGAAGSEGTAMLEIVHDLAPGADLMFGNFGFDSGDDFNDAVNCLAANNDIVVDDIGFFGAGHYDGTSYISENTAGALNSGGPIRAYFTSVGNQADRHYQGPYVDSGVDYVDGPASWSLHSFASGGPLNTKSSGLNADPSHLNSFMLEPDGTATVWVVWDDPVFNHSANDYDLFIFGGPAPQPCIGGNFQGTPGTFPRETCSVENMTGGNVQYDIALGNFMDTQAPVEFDLFLLCRGCLSLANGNKLDFDTYNNSVANQGDAGGSPVSVVSVGAVDVDDPGNDDIEFFSSIGPTNDGRMKPDVSGPDGVSTSTAGFTTFFGTSAAAPHAAGVAALILDCNGSLNRQGLRSALLDNARDIEAPGPDQLSGTGHIDALASANAVGCAGGGDTPTATVTNTPPGPTNTATNTPPGPTNTPTPTDPPPACADDAYEENDSVASAALLMPPVNLPGLAACPGDDDWYRFQLDLNQEVTIEAFFPHAEGDVDLYLYGLSVGPTLATSVTFTDNELINYQAEGSGTHYLQVDLFADLGSQAGNQYNLTISLSDPFLYGDASCNQAVNAIDAAIVLQFVASLINVLGCEEAADVNLDGVVNSIDAALILQYVAGLIGLLPV